MMRDLTDFYYIYFQLYTSYYLLIHTLNVIKIHCRELADHSGRISDVPQIVVSLKHYPFFAPNLLMKSDKSLMWGITFSRTHSKINSIMSSWKSVMLHIWLYMLGYIMESASLILITFNFVQRLEVGQFTARLGRISEDSRFWFM